MTDFGETLIDYELLNDARKAEKAGLFPRGDHSENEDRHISLLDELMTALDAKEVFVVTRNFVRYHRDTFAKTLLYLEKTERERFEKEGERKNDQHTNV